MRILIFPSRIPGIKVCSTHGRVWYFTNKETKHRAGDLLDIRDKEQSESGFYPRTPRPQTLELVSSTVMSKPGSFHELV